MSRKVPVIIGLHVVLLSVLGVNPVGVLQSQKIQATTIGLPTTMPAIYVDPPDITGVGPGETFTISIKIFNLTTNFWQTYESWERGEELGPWTNYPPYNYSLGNLIGLEFQLGWDDTVLKFVSNITKIPVDQYSDGILYSPILKLMDNVTETSFPYPQPEKSKYWLAYLTFDATKPFNGNGTVVELTFEVLKEGVTDLDITSSRLGDQRGEPIPHKFLSGMFRSPDARTRLGEIDVGVFVAGEHLSPVLVGEDVNVSVQVRNDGNVTDTYNLTLSYDNDPLQDAVWTAQTLDPGNSSIFTYILNASTLSSGLHNISSYLNILHDGGLFADNSSQQFRVIDPPQLVVSGPSSAEAGQTVVFNASNSIHLDPDGYISKYTWGIYGPEETMPRGKGVGVTFSHDILPSGPNGTWRVVLSVEDNFGVTYSESRPFSLPYTAEVPLIIAAYPVIYIKADGSINPATANITSFDNVTYTFTADINASLVVLKNDIVVDGARHTLQGNGGETGIDLSLRHNVTLQDVDVTDFSYGIFLSSSSNSTIIGNTASNNGYGIRLLDSSNSTIIGNTASNNWYGIVLSSSSNNTVAGNTVSSNSYNGIVLSSSSNNTVAGNTVSSNSDNGIVLYSSSNNVLASNTASSNNMYGIQLSSSSNNTVAGNTISSNGYDGIGLWDSSNNTIIGNTASNNLYGIRLGFSGNNVLTGNTAANNQHNFGVDGWLFSHFNNYVDTSNTVDGKPIYYLMGVADAVYDAETNAGAIYLINSNNITIEDLTLTRNHFGALFFNTTNSKIENITVANNYVGIYLLDSSNNVLASNTASSNNMYGIQLYSSSNNVLFHNNLINNTNPTYTLASFNNTWDDGYPSGGNYWSNYTGLDADGDGIGDVPYTIGSNVDNYPLMGMFSDFVVTSEYHVQAICNSSISDFQYNGTAISFNVTGETDTAGFWRICIPRAMMNETYHVFVNGMEVPCNLLPCSDSTHSYLYFSYNHSTHEVIVIPEFPLLTILSLLMITTLLTALIYKKKSLPRANVSRGEALLHLGK